MEIEIYSSSSEEETFQLGLELSTRVVPGDVLAFYGELGAGKTELIKGFCQGMSVEEIVSSPTYTIVNQYAGEDDHGRQIEIFHIDLYRIESSGELLEIGIRDILDDPTAIKLIEWAENADSILPRVRYDIYLSSTDDENGRRIEIIHRGLNGGGENGSVRAYTRAR